MLFGKWLMLILKSKIVKVVNKFDGFKVEVFNIIKMCVINSFVYYWYDFWKN